MSDVVVITGASAGVGRAVARRFGASKAKIGLLARNRSRLEKAATEIEKAGGAALVCPVDVADFAAVDGAAEPSAGHRQVDRARHDRGRGRVSLYEHSVNEPGQPAGR